MGARGIREVSFEFVKDLFGEQAGSPPIVIEQLRVIRALSQGFLKNCHRLRQFARVEQSYAERVLGMPLLQMWNRFSSIPLRQECVSQQAVARFEVGAELDGSLQRRNSGRIITLLDVYPAEIGERGCQLGIEFGGLLK